MFKVRANLFGSDKGLFDLLDSKFGLNAILFFFQR